MARLPRWEAHRAAMVSGPPAGGPAGPSCTGDWTSSRLRDHACWTTPVIRSRHSIRFPASFPARLAVTSKRTCLNSRRIKSAPSISSSVARRWNTCPGRKSVASYGAFETAGRRTSSLRFPTKASKFDSSSIGTSTRFGRALPFARGGRCARSARAPMEMDITGRSDTETTA